MEMVFRVRLETREGGGLFVEKLRKASSEVAPAHGVIELEASWGNFKLSKKELAEYELVGAPSRLWPCVVSLGLKDNHEVVLRKGETWE